MAQFDVFENASIAYLAFVFMPDSDPRPKLSTFEKSQRYAMQLQYEAELFSLAM